VNAFAREAAGGTATAERRCQRMSIRCDVETAFFIAWSGLEKSGELGDPEASANILLDAIEAQLGTGERRPLMLGNKAIATYRTHPHPAAGRQARRAAVPNSP
jgi:hypothetical protein